MKRINGLYQKISSLENLRLADQKARKSKAKQYGVIAHDKNREANLEKLHMMLTTRTYSTSNYTTFKVYEPKERDVYRLPYFPDRITHHAIMNVLEPIWVSTFTADTYSCIKGKGIHGAFRSLRKALNDKESTEYCLKMDVRKFYPSIDHYVLKQIVRRKIKDKDLLYLLDEIIDSADGVPIGNYLSQYFANLYLTYFDHWLKEQKAVKYYYRYADDIVILGSNKPYLHALLADIKEYLNNRLKLDVKDNYQVFPVEKRGIDFVGYKFFHTHTLVRKSIKKAFCRKLKKGASLNTIASYWGWLKHANTKNLINKLSLSIDMKKFSELNIEASIKPFSGDKKNIEEILNCEIELLDFKIEPSKFDGRLLTLDYNLRGKNHLTFTGSESLCEILEKVSKEDLPFTATVVKEFKRYVLK